MADHPERAPGPPVPTAVVFDLGGVLIDWNPRHLYRSLFADEAAMERFLAEVCTPDWNALQDAGRSWTEAIELLAARFPEQRDLISAYWLRWPEMLGGPIDPTVELLEELRDARVRLYALSNWSAETFSLARPRFPFLDWFDGILISGDVRMVKPDPRIFRLLLERYRLDPGDTIFVDDADANVAAAAAVGLRAIRFDGAPALRHELVSLGLPLRPVA